MPYHVEISSSPHHARVFNLDEAELQAAVLEPWIAGLSFELGEKEWDPRECRLTILEGRRLEGPDLSFGQGWSNALRVAEDVTRARLEAAEASAPARAAATIEATTLEAALTGLRSGRTIQTVHWAEAVERVAGRDPEVAAVILVLRPPEPEDRQS